MSRPYLRWHHRKVGKVSFDEPKAQSGMNMKNATYIEQISRNEDFPYLTSLQMLDTAAAVHEWVSHWIYHDGL